MLTVGYGCGVREFWCKDSKIQSAIYELYKNKRHKKYFRECLWKDKGYFHHCKEVDESFSTLSFCGLLGVLSIAGADRYVLLGRMWHNKDFKFDRNELHDINNMAGKFFEKIACQEHECVL